jgi:hypothetical protein
MRSDSSEIAQRSKLTPPQIAEQWGISPEKVIAWIRRGELRAINVAERRSGRPRYVVDIDDLEAFEGSRMVSPPARTVRRRRAAKVFEFF